MSSSLLFHLLQIIATRLPGRLNWFIIDNSATLLSWQNKNSAQDNAIAIATSQQCLVRRDVEKHRCRLNSPLPGRWRIIPSDNQLKWLLAKLFSCFQLFYACQRAAEAIKWLIFVVGAIFVSRSAGQNDFMKMKFLRKVNFDFISITSRLMMIGCRLKCFDFWYVNLGIWDGVEMEWPIDVGFIWFWMIIF